MARDTTQTRWMLTGARSPLLIRLALALAVAFGGTVLPATGAAQSDMERAKQAFRKGEELYQKGSYEKAAETFHRAYELSGREELLYNIGQAYRRAGQLEKAEKYFQKYLNKKPNASNSGEVVQKVVKIQEKLAARMGSIRVETAQKGRSVRIDEEDKPRCSTPCSVSIKSGTYDVHISGEGVQTVTEKVDIAEGGEKSLSIELPAESAPGRLHVRTAQGGGALQVEGAGETSLPMTKPIEIAPGKHQLKVTGPSGEVWTGDVEVQSGETSRLLVTTAPQPTRASSGSNIRRSVAFGLAGASIALVSGGLLLGQNARRTHEILSAQQRRNGRVDPELLSKGRREQTAANILLGTGAATLLSGAGLMVWDAVDSNEQPKRGDADDTDARAGASIRP